MPPVLQRLVALAVRVPFGLLLLRQMSLAVSDDLTHVGNVLLLISLRVLGGIFVQYLDDLAATDQVLEPFPECETHARPRTIVPFMPDCLAGTVIFAPT